MQLHSLLQNIEHETIHHGENIDISSLHLDSQEVEKGGLFFAVPGALQDGHDFIDQAVERGAVAIVCEEFPDVMDETVHYVRVDNVRQTMGKIAHLFYDKPSTRLKVVAVTGTNGKTTVAMVLHQLFQNMGYDAGLLSTVENKINDEVMPHDDGATTTQHALALHKAFARMIEAGCEYCFMEVSSHALDQYRVSGIEFTGAIFMNITHDHLDYHGTFKNYMTAKKKLFDMLHPHTWALANMDDENGEFMLQHSKAAQYYYGFQKEDGSFSGKLSFEGELIENTFDGITITANGEVVCSNLIGSFNAYNMLAVYGSAKLLDIGHGAVAKAFETIKPAPGRFEIVRNGDRVGIVDYAHTPDALENVLKTLHAIKKEDQKIVTVIGCGGDRDVEKRPVMARIAQSLSSAIVLTSDNPRTEEPLSIINDMKEGLAQRDNDVVHIVPDRAEAIDTAVYVAGENGIILVAGKGHETYQIIGTENIDFDDRKILREKLGKY